MSRVISKDQAGGYEPWDPPDMEGHSADSAMGPSPAGEQKRAAMLTATQLEELQRQAYEEAYEQGKKEGFAFGHREAEEAGRQQIEAHKARLRDTVARFAQLLQALERPFAELDDQVENELVTLATALVKQLVRREIKIDPGEVVGVVRESLRALPVSARNIQVHLHPEDVTVVREAFAATDSESSWITVDDPSITRGGCCVVTETSRIDATLESRLNALISSVFGGQRVDDASP